MNTRALVEAVPFWFHSYNFGDGVLAKGHKSVDILEQEWNNLRLPDLQGKTLLDVNAWDGWFSFRAEAAGAAVTALDFHAWSLRWNDHREYWAECRKKGIVPKPPGEMGYYKPQELPGRAGFNTAHQVLKSTVKVVVGDFMEIDLAQLGQF